MVLPEEEEEAVVIDIEPKGEEEELIPPEVEEKEPIPKEPEKSAVLPEKALYYIKLQQEGK